MASGSQNMTTYNARVVTGSNSAASPAGALLLSGAGRADDATGDTWLFLDSRGGTSTPWGIKHDQANNKIQIFGAGTNSVWTQMNTGNTYILGKVGINTESPSAKLHIYQATNNAATQHEPALRIEGKLDIYDNATGGGVANSLLNILYNGTHEYGVPVKIHSYGGDSPAIRFSKSASIDDINKEVNTSWTVGMYYNSSNAFAITRGRGPAGWGTADLMIDNSGRVGIGTTAPAYKLDISGTAHISDTTTLGSRETSTAPSALSSVDRLIITPYYHTGGPWKITSKDDASNAYLSLYYSTTETARMQHNGTLLLCNNISFTNSGTAFRGINYGTMGDNDQWRIGGAATAANAGYMELATADDGNEPIYVRQYTGVFTTVKRTLTLLDASGNTTFPGSFYFGGDGIYHSGTAATQRIIRIIDSGDQYGTGISIGAGGLALFGSGESTSTVISNLSLTAGGTETTYITSDNAIYFYSNQNSYNANMYMSMNNSQLLISGSTSGGMAHNTTNPKITFVENQSTQPVHLIYTDQDSYRAPAGLKIVGGASATPAWFEVEGNIYNGGSIYTTNAGECGLEVNNTQATNPNQGAFIVGSSGNLGIYSRKHSKWVVACDASGNVSLNGNAATATTWQTARTLTIGATGKSVNGSANVSWSKAEIMGSGNTGQFLRGDHAYTNALLGPLLIGTSDAAANTGYATANVGVNNYIAFYGVYGDNPGSYNHSYIGERIYGSKTAANEQSELLLFHGNDAGSGSGPDRIRLFAGQIDIQVYSSATSGSFMAVGEAAHIQVANFANGQVTVTGHVIANDGYLKSTLNSNTVTIGSQNTSFCHIENSANIPFWFNRSIQMAQNTTIGSASTQYRPFQLYLGRYTTTASNALNAANPLIEFSNSDRSQYCQLMYDDHDSLCPPDSLTLVGNQNGIFFICKNGPIWVQGGSNAGGNVNRLNLSSGMPGNMLYNTSRRGTQIYSNGIAFADPYNGNNNNDAGWIRHIETTANTGYLEIGVGDDGNEEIIARQYNTSSNVARQMYLLNSAGFTSVSNQSTDSSYAHAAMQIRETNYAGAGSDTWGQAPRLAWHWGGRVAAQIGLASNGYLYSAPLTATNFYRLVLETTTVTWGINITGSSGSCTGNAATATKATQDGSGNTITSYYCTLSTAQTFTGNKTFNSICYFANGTTYYVNKNGDCRLRYLGCGNLDASTSYAIRIGGNAYISGHHYFGNGTTYYINSSGTGNLNALTVNATTASSSTATGALIVKGGIGAAGKIYGSQVYNAVWNDYAECREVEIEEPGYCVTEAINGKMIKTTKRLEAGCKITSDTYGTCMGETEKAKTPIAVAGRVLVYPYRARQEYTLGAAVCSAPNGTVDIMTRDEIMMYPERIVGTVSEIPDYEIWSGGAQNGKDDIQVNGRIWIYVR